MQVKGYVEIDSVIYKVIMRTKSSYKQLKLRTKGPKGVHLILEEEYLSDKKNANTITDLTKGEQIKIPIDND